VPKYVRGNAKEMANRLAMNKPAAGNCHPEYNQTFGNGSEGVVGNCTQL
jgi:hypothetical protein